MPRRTLHFRRAYDTADRIVRLVERRDPAECIEDHLQVGQSLFIQTVSKPQPVTLLHQLIHSVLSSDLDYSTGHYPEAAVADYRALLEDAAVPIPVWLDEESVSGWICELDELLTMAVQPQVDATFHLLFSDREFLVGFNDLVAEFIRASQPGKASLALARPHSLPMWLRKAVFFRDKGRCQLCHADVSGVLSIAANAYDHIHPLARCGSNDPTNFQLLCPGCNTRKGIALDRHRFGTETFW